MDSLWWILAGGVLMSAIGLLGNLTLLLSEAAPERVITPLVALAAGSLLGGAFFLMLPAAMQAAPAHLSVVSWVSIGSSLFFALQQLLHWHHCQRASSDCKKPLTYLVPEVDRHRDSATSVLHFASFAAGIALLWWICVVLGPVG